MWWLSKLRWYHYGFGQIKSRFLISTILVLPVHQSFKKFQELQLITEIKGWVNPIRGGGGGGGAAPLLSFLYNFLYHKATVLIFCDFSANSIWKMVKKNFLNIWIYTQITQILAGGRSKKKGKYIYFFSNLTYIFLERKFNFQYNGENFKCIAYLERKLFKF